MAAEPTGSTANADARSGVADGYTGWRSSTDTNASSS
jgi:hypothetical protein